MDALKSRKLEVWLNGRLVEKVYDEPYFQQPIKEIAKLYDLQHDSKYQEDLTHVCDETGERVATSFLFVDAELRMKIFKLVWDLCSEGFSMRALQYERYYTGDPIRKRAIYYNKFKKRYSFDLVESIFAKEDVGEKQSV